ncbi:MAG TPA: hypothetical protein VEJ46_13690 [Candidatus Acidoferrum sp.]|nr:hypothetical protein [Candidatus Acidoferrum sp.]
MELLLNLIWVLMAAGVLWTWRAHWVHQRKRVLAHSLREWTAVSLALILLFFAVSMTDDLHADLIVFDECSTSRRGSSLVIGAHQPLVHSGTVLQGASSTVVTSPFRFDALQVVDNVDLVARPFAVMPSAGSMAGRAPPFLFGKA